MKSIQYIIILLVGVFFSIPSEFEAADTLQTKINKARPGAVIEIEQGEYEEAIIITKPLTLKGIGEVLIRSCKEEPTVTINGENIKLINIGVEYCGETEEAAAIFVSGLNHNLTGLHIRSNRFGVRLHGANQVTIQNSKITGSAQGNGVDLWQSNRNQLQNLTIANVLDGIYLEQSNDNMLSENDISQSRYGMHLMFSDDNRLMKNRSASNITGTMLMESNRTIVSHNEFSFNHQNVNAQGLLIYLASDTKVTENKFHSNRVGIFIEEAKRNTIVSNKMTDNFIGVQFKKATENKAVNNTFAGNVNNAQAIESAHNQVDSNYWDTAGKIDVNGDYKSEIAYTADPYFLTLTNNTPEYGLFFDAPGMILLQNLMKSPAEQLLTDSAPLMGVTMEIEKETSSRLSLWTMSFGMIAVSLSLFIAGRRKK